MSSDAPTRTTLRQAEWHEAGLETARLIDRSGIKKRYLVARELGWGPSKLSRVLNGRQLPSPDELQSIDRFLADRVPEYTGGDVMDVWYPRTTQGQPSPAAPADSADEVTTLERQRIRLKPSVALLVAGGLAIAILIVWFLWARDTATTDSGEASAKSSGCVFAAGETTPGNSERLAAYAPLLETALADAGGSSAVGCPSSTMETWQDLVVQPLAFADRPGGAIVAADDSTAVVLSWTAWISYRQIGGKSGDNAQELAGLPIETRTEAGLFIVDLDRGGYLVAEAEDAPYFWAPELAVARIEEYGGLAGELGRPTGYPLVRDGYFLQDFLHGVATLDPDGTIAVDIIDDPGSELAEFEPIAGAILRQTDGTAWYVTDERTRQWIPDGGVWECLGGWDNVVGNDVAGWTVASLPYDGHATCP